MRSVGGNTQALPGTERSSQGAFLRFGGCFDEWVRPVHKEAARCGRGSKPPAHSSKHLLTSGRVRMNESMPMKSGHRKSDTRHADNTARPARTLIEVSGQAGAEW